MLPVLFVLASCQRARTPVERGRAVFNGFGCSSCHRIGNQGGVLGPDLTFIGFRKSKEWLGLWLKNPHGWKNNTLMPNFNLAEGTRNDLVEYLAALRGQDFDGHRPWDAEHLAENPIERGKVIFARAGCVGCHGVGGVGGYPNNNVVGGQIPALIFVADGYSKDELKERIREGKVSDKENPKLSAPMIEMPKWGEVLEEHEMDALVEYLYSIRPAKAAGEEW